MLSNDYGRYSEMGIKLEPSNTNFNFRDGMRIQILLFNDQAIFIQICHDFVKKKNFKFLKSLGWYLENTQGHNNFKIRPSVWDFDFVHYYRKAYENESIPWVKEHKMSSLQMAEAQRDFYTPSIKEINHLVQLDSHANTDLKESKWELYKISVSFSFKRKKYIF